MQEGLQLPELLVKIKVLREAGLRAEHVAFSFMKRRVHPLMARDTLGYQYTGDGDSSWMPDGEIDDDDIIDRLGRILLTQNQHLAPSTQQAEEAGLTHGMDSEACQSIFLKLTKE
jgi:hypothetical protein